MKNLLWLINFTLLILLATVLLYIGFSVNKLFTVPKFKTSIKAKTHEAVTAAMPTAKDIRFIEEKDIFKTVIPNLFPEVGHIKIPNPPTPKPVMPYQAPAVQFLEALPITITGIIPSSIEANSHVIIMNNNTKLSNSYKVGDKIFDAYLVRILPAKIILIRSNGQQETIFMNTEDAKAEIKSIKEASWTDVVKRLTESDFLIDVNNFAKKVQNLAYLIEMLDATTAFKQDVSIGCKIGRMPSHSIGHSLGLLPGDIITYILDIEPITTENRVKIYNEIKDLKLGSTINITIHRRNRSMVLNYTLSNFNSDPSMNPEDIDTTPNTPEITEKRVSIEQEALRPVNHRMKRNDKQMMSQFGSKNSVLKGLK